MQVKPYSLFQYAQIDGRITYRILPHRGRNLLLTNIKQLAIDHCHDDVERLKCDLILLSFEPTALVTFDAQYNVVGDYESLIKEGTPVVFFIQGDVVFAEALNIEDFSAKY